MGRFCFISVAERFLAAARPHFLSYHFQNSNVILWGEVLIPILAIPQNLNNQGRATSEDLIRINHYFYRNINNTLIFFIIASILE